VKSCFVRCHTTEPGVGCFLRLVTSNGRAIATMMKMIMAAVVLGKDSSFG